MIPLGPGAPAPPIPGADLGHGAHAVLFYKVTCPACQMAAPVAERLYRAAGDRLVAVAQDPAERVRDFGAALGTTFPSRPDTPPYEVSNAYGVRTVPTLFLVRDGRVDDVVESWERDGWNRLAGKLGTAIGRPAEALSWEGDGLPPMRPG